MILSLIIIIEMLNKNILIRHLFNLIIYLDGIMFKVVDGLRYIYIMWIAKLMNGYILGIISVS